MENPPMGGLIGKVYGAVREALERGRELGARDELKWCEAVAVEEMCGSKRTMAERLTGQRIVEQIQARRSGGQGK
jgi:hypothetical protein